MPGKVRIALEIEEFSDHIPIALSELDSCSLGKGITTLYNFFVEFGIGRKGDVLLLDGSVHQDFLGSGKLLAMHLDREGK